MGEKIIYVTYPLPNPNPDPPVFVKVTDAELKCLPDPVYGKLAWSDNGWKQYTDELRAIIESTKMGSSPKQFEDFGRDHRL